MEKTCSKQGSLSLEAALVMPVVLLMLWSFLAMLSALTAEIKLKGALDRTAAELGLISPLTRAIESIADEIQNDRLSEEDGARSREIPEIGTDARITELEGVVRAIMPEFSLQDLARDLILDVSTSALMGQVIQQRIQYWLDEAETGQSVRSGTAVSSWEKRLRDRRIFLDWRVDKKQLWLCLSYRLETPLGSARRLIKSVVPLWIGEAADTKPGDAASPDGSAWLLDNFSRGQQIRSEMGGDLPYDFPVIASFSDGEATMIKSLDLTAPVYQQQGELLAQVKEHLDHLADFSGALYEREDQVIRIEPGQIMARRMILVVPANAGQSWLDDAWSILDRQARSRGTELQIVQYGDSTRYQP